ncbi:MAG: serine/threonine protein kinase [Akkermansiaceae bacterium]|nr:serine/threonine protein kinase [Akkermansiaceae bacterium]
MPEEYRNALPAGKLIDTYRIERVLGEGGFGITYLVRELNLDKHFAMKELLPDGIAMRRTGDTSYVEAKSSGTEADFAATRKYFISEARVLARMDHPAVVSVQRLMEANGTCYMVMDYVEGETLGDYLKKHGGTFRSKAEFERIFYPLMSGLEVLHGQGIIHRDIKPGNIMVKPDGSPVLLDFGAATQVQSKTMTITQMLSAGYSPFEQYTSRAKQGPYTDIYALGATMLKCITGKKPDDASDRMYGDRYKPLAGSEAYVSVYGESLLAAVDAALQMDAERRPQAVAEWRRVMESKEQEIGVDIPARKEVSVSTPTSLVHERPLAVRIGGPKQEEAGCRSFISQTKRDLAFLLWMMERKWGVRNPKAVLKAWAIACVIFVIFCIVMVSILGHL